MKHLRYALIATGLFFASQADAATCFWVGGTGTWSTSNTASWASSSGGTGGTCAATGGIPKQAADTATIDGNAAGLNGGTITVDSTMNGTTLTEILADAMIGTLDFSVNNPSMTMTELSSSGSGVRTIKLGSGTFNLNAAFNNPLNIGGSNLTLTAGTSTIVMSAAVSNNRQINFGTGISYHNVTVADSGNLSQRTTFSQGAGTSIASLTITGPIWIVPGSNLSIGTSLVITSTSTTPVTLMNFDSGGSWTVPASTSWNWSSIGHMTFTGSPTANNSFNMGGNSGITVNAPTSGGGGHIIGG